MERFEALRKKAIFQAARRAMLENEMFLREYVTSHLPEDYGEKELEDLNAMLEKIFDNDLFDVVMGTRKYTEFDGMYDQRLLGDIAEYAEKHRAKIKKDKGLI